MDDIENHKISNVKQDYRHCVHINPKTKIEVKTENETKAKGKTQGLWDSRRKESPKDLERDYFIFGPSFA